MKSYKVELTKIVILTQTIFVECEDEKQVLEVASNSYCSGEWKQQTEVILPKIVG